MASDRITWTDRLRDRGYIDQWGFAFFAAIGSLGIFAAKYFNVGTKWVVFGAIAAMLAYAAIVARRGSGRLAADQAGDNCYYLGLIYTLTSLSFAIIFFDPNDTASTIVQGFGVALGTTIVGLILRVFFNQGRPDLENVEERARLELTHAASTLTTELGQASVTMKDFAHQLTQSLGEVRDEAAKQIRGFTESSVAGLQEVVATADEAIRSQSNDFASRSKKYGTAFDELIGKLDAHTEKVGALSQAHGSLLDSAEAIRSASIDARDAVSAFNAGARETGAALTSIGGQSQATREMIDGLSATLADLQGAITRFQMDAQSRLDALTDAPGASVKNAAHAISQAASKLETEIEALIVTHSKAAGGIAEQTASALALTQRHNEAIEQELQRARGLYGRVFDGFVSITDDLAKKAEAQN